MCRRSSTAINHVCKQEPESKQALRRLQIRIVTIENRATEHLQTERLRLQTCTIRKLGALGVRFVASFPGPLC